MTATAIETTLHTPVDVRFVSGRPLAVRYDGRIWVVTGDPVRRLAGDLREIQRTVQPGAEHWRVQVLLSSASALRTFDLRHDPAGQWLLESITD
ncbi:hypothetical protein [Arthrobacter sp. 9AX]|uniref:hypothetical protein n=1 Tax=Arthrobacter sp. 9AX TaxID=2653131 RepID=UPI001F435A7E|nr:hypothetical protein [Arthrobacter sp. 9AX]